MSFENTMKYVEENKEGYIRKMIEKDNQNRVFEIQAVKDLGERIGYGNMMDIASALWANKLDETGVPISGAFVPVCLFQLKEKEKKRISSRLEAMRKHVEEYR